MITERYIRQIIVGILAIVIGIWFFSSLLPELYQEYSNVDTVYKNIDKMKDYCSERKCSYNEETSEKEYKVTCFCDNEIIEQTLNKDTLKIKRKVIE